MSTENNKNRGPLSFSAVGAMALKDNLFRYFEKMGLNPLVTEEWKRGIFQLFGIKTINLPNFDADNYILASNHISDFDAVILGLLHPQIRIIAKMEWVSNPDLNEFLRLHYNIVGIYRDSEIEKLDEENKRAAKEHNYKVTIDALKHLKDGDRPRHLLIFPQGTISDINKNSLARINPGFGKIARMTKTRIVNIFLEYPKMDDITRIVGSSPYVAEGADHARIWLDGVISLQNQLKNVRTPVLSEKHSLNNSPDEPYF